MTLRRFMAVAAVLVLVGCDDDVPEGILFEEPAEKELAGLWTGTEEITHDGTMHAVGGVTGGVDDGFSFAVSLMLEKDRTFTLRSFGFPVNAEEDWSCRGVYRVDGRTLEFFPNAACRALPLHRYTIGRYFPEGLSLQAETQGDAGASIRVQIRVERG